MKDCTQEISSRTPQHPSVIRFSRHYSDTALTIFAMVVTVFLSVQPVIPRTKYVDTPLVGAIRYGYLVELQEPTVIANPGVLVGLNSLLDRCNSVFLPNGEVINRHPDTTIVVTTNNDYAGCKQMNQSVISRMNLVIHSPHLFLCNLIIPHKKPPLRRKDRMLYHGRTSDGKSILIA